LPALSLAKSKAKYARWIGFSANNRTDPSCILQYDFENREDDAVLANKAHGIDVESYSQEMFDATVYAASWTNSEARWRGGKGGMVFNGSSSYAATGDISNTLIDDPTGEDISFAVWFRALDLTSTGYLLSTGGESNTRQGIAALVYANEMAAAGVRTENFRSKSGAVIPYKMNEWQHLVTTYDSETGESSYYLNGKLVAAGTVTSWNQLSDDRNRVAVGALPWSGVSYGFLGVIDEVLVYNRTLDVQEAQDHYVMGQP
jgi:hypothetical protein